MKLQLCRPLKTGILQTSTPDCLHGLLSRPFLLSNPVFSYVLIFFPFLVPCARLSWPFVSFWAPVNIQSCIISYSKRSRVTSVNSLVNKFYLDGASVLNSFSALTVLVEWQKGYPACSKNRLHSSANVLYCNKWRKKINGVNPNSPIANDH